MIARVVQLLVFAFTFTSCVANYKDRDLKNILSEVLLNEVYTINDFDTEAVGWNDSFQSGSVTFIDQEAVKKLLAVSKRVGYKEYIPIKESPLEIKLKGEEPPQVWLYKSRGRRDRRLYFVVEYNRIFFELLLF